MLLQVENITLDSAYQVYSTKSFIAQEDGIYNLSIAGGDIDYIAGTYLGYDGAIAVNVFKNTILEDQIVFITTALFPLKNLQIDLNFGDELTFSFDSDLEGGIVDVVINTINIVVNINPFALQMSDVVPIRDLMPCNVYECLGVGDRFFFQLSAKGREVLDTNKTTNPTITGGGTGWSFIGNVDVPGGQSYITQILDGTLNAGTAAQSIALDAKKHYLVLNLVTSQDISTFPADFVLNISLSNFSQNTVFSRDLTIADWSSTIGETTGVYFEFVIEQADTFNLVFWFNSGGIDTIIPLQTIGIDDIYLFPVNMEFPNIDTLTAVGCDSYDGYFICDNDWVEDEWVECNWVGDEWLEEPNSENGSVIYSVVLTQNQECIVITVEAITPEDGEFYFILEDTEGNTWQTVTMCKMDDDSGLTKYQFIGGNGVNYTLISFIPTFYLNMGIYADSPSGTENITFENYNGRFVKFFNNQKAEYFLNTGVYENAIHNWLAKTLLSKQVYIENKKYTSLSSSGYSLTHNTKGLYTGRFNGLVNLK